MNIRRFSIFILLMSFLFILNACNSEETKHREIEKVEKNQEQPKEKDLNQDIVVEYDELQQLYLDLNEAETYEGLIGKLEASNLFYKEFSGQGNSIKIAFDEAVTPFKHAEEGDNLQVSFAEDFTFNHATYFNHKIFITLLDYQNGTYYSFRDQPEYAGYYINTYLDKAGTFKIKYSNGNEAEVDYLKVESKVEQLKYMYEYEKKKK